MSIKDIKAEARRKLALNIHQAIVIYTVEFAVYITLIALVVLACVCLNAINKIAAIVMICYGVLLLLIAMVGSGMVNFAMVDYYLASYKCKPYNVRRLGDTLARSGATKILIISIKRTLLGFLLFLCLIVPGVIYLIRTSMANHLLVANPKMKASTALSASNKVMSGKTGSYFSLVMSLFGWFILGVITLGLGFIFITPYINLVKTVYYKRNLQGDKAVYNVAVQPVSPVPFVYSAPRDIPAGVVGGQPVSPVDASVNASAPITEPARPIHIDNPAPIDTLEDVDMLEMNAAMRDFGEDLGKNDIDVPEVPISPVTTAKKPAQQSNRDAFNSRPVENSDLIETERVLSTKELDDSDVLNKKIDEMYSRSAPKSSGYDYISATRKQNPNDFVTSEVDEAVAEPSVEAEPVSAGETDDFAEFLRDFGGIEQQAEFKPLRRSAEKSDFGMTGLEKDDNTAKPTEPVGRETVSDRTERMRREREERLKNIKR